MASGSFLDSHDGGPGSHSFTVRWKSLIICQLLVYLWLRCHTVGSQITKKGSQESKRLLSLTLWLTKQFKLFQQRIQHPKARTFNFDTHLSQRFESGDWLSFIICGIFMMHSLRMSEGNRIWRVKLGAIEIQNCTSNYFRNGISCQNAIIASEIKAIAFDIWWDNAKIDAIAESMEFEAMNGIFINAL